MIVCLGHTEGDANWWRISTTLAEKYYGGGEAAGGLRGEILMKRPQAEKVPAGLPKEFNTV
jgi:hypothetical protein